MSNDTFTIHYIFFFIPAHFLPCTQIHRYGEQQGLLASDPKQRGKKCLAQRHNEAAQVKAFTTTFFSPPSGPEHGRQML